MDCRQCGKEFTPRERKKGPKFGFYCSRQCFFEHRRRRLKEFDVSKFWSNCEKGEMHECWPWRGRLYGGYGKYGFAYRQFLAHRLAFILTHGSIPSGLTLDHLCRNRACINPAHLEPVTLAENVLRGESPPTKNRERTHCLNGHPLSGSNLYFYGPMKNWRGCLTCRRKRNAEWHRMWRGKIYGH